MIVALIIASVALLIVPGMSRGALTRISGAEATRLTLFAVCAGAVSLLFGLIALAVPSVGHTLGIPALEACRSVIGGFEPGGHLVGWIAAGAAASLVGRTVLTLVRLQRARHVEVEAWIGIHEERVAFDLVMLPTDELVAFGAHRPDPPQIVISDGIRAVLTVDELEAVVEHERAHLDLRHHRHLRALALVDDAFGWIPFVRESTRQARNAIERWADEACSADPATRAALARALVTVAASDRPINAPTGDGRGVLDRTACLRHPPGPPPLTVRARALAPASALAATAVVLATLWLGVLAAGGVPVTGCH